MHGQRVVVALAAVVGLIGVFLPWVRIPFLGSVSGIETEGWGVGLLVACGAALASALVGTSNMPLGIWSRFVGIFSGLAMCGYPGWMLFELYQESAGGLAGAGLYVLLLAGLVIVIVPDRIPETPKTAGN